MPVFIDTEFTRFKGDLISIALVADDGDELYCVRRFDMAGIDPWVVDNVLPVLNQKPESDDSIKSKLVAFLNRQREQPIYADWPEDLSHLLNLLVEPQGYQYDVGELDLRLIRGLDTVPAVPHNALHDARALRDAFYGEHDIYGAAV
jgi:hypothetical protein